MGTWDRIAAALRREKRDVAEAVDEFTQRSNAALDERERDLGATPEEKLAREQRRGEEIDDELEAVRRRIEGGRPDST
ncbi:MAG TPA: hypothetical protein VM143_17820 [Acidimicrobiales bacterium]|nr:hypothetical protein [Acidimicrobiales bacterium]